MAGYELLITAKAAKEIDALPRQRERRAIVDRILALRDDPRPAGCTKLGGETGLYRVRQGRYRIVYTVEDDRLVVIVIRVADRKDVYRKSERSKSGARRFDPPPSDRGH